MQGSEPVLASFISSGDLLVDRRYAFARDLAARGDHAAAADLLAQVVERAPTFAAGWFALGEACEKLSDRDGAIAAFRQALACDADDRHGARLHLARLGAEQAGTAMSPAYVASLFDQYAPRFDAALAELHYRGPALLHDAVQAACRDAGRPMRFASVLDLGCGTGLAGAAFRRYADRLVGLDLSPRMVAAARAKGLYDALDTCDLVRGLDEAHASGARHDLILAADVFVYCADLNPVLAAAARVLAADGLFAFTLETHAGAGVILGEKLRYAHGADHVRAALAHAGLTPLSVAPAATRTENQVPVPGLVVVARPSLR